MSVNNTNSNIPTSGEVRPATLVSTPQTKSKSIGDHVSALGNQASKAASSTWSGITGMFKSKPAAAPVTTSVAPTTTVGGRRKHKRSAHKKRTRKHRTRKHRGGAECNLLQTKRTDGKCYNCPKWYVPHRTTPGQCVKYPKDYVKLFKEQKKADKKATKMATKKATKMVAQTAPVQSAPIAPVAPVAPIAAAMLGGNPKKGKKSKTRKGRKDFVTHKGDKFYNRKGKRQTKSRKGKKGKPYSHRK